MARITNLLLPDVGVLVRIGGVVVVRIVVVVGKLGTGQSREAHQENQCQFHLQSINQC